MLQSALAAIRSISDAPNASRTDNIVDAPLVAFTVVGLVVTVAYLALLSYVAGMPA